MTGNGSISTTYRDTTGKVIRQVRPRSRRVRFGQSGCAFPYSERLKGGYWSVTKRRA